MKVVFLDIDGVMNSQEFFMERKERGLDLDESRFPLLKNIIDKTGAKIVLSSVWRTCLESPHFSQLPKMLKKYEMEIYDNTPVLNQDRDAEIKMWLDTHSDIEQFIIIDDDDFNISELKSNLIQTRPFVERGLTKSHVAMAIRKLNGGGRTD